MGNDKFGNDKVLQSNVYTFIKLVCLMQIID